MKKKNTAPVAVAAVLAVAAIALIYRNSQTDTPVTTGTGNPIPQPVPRPTSPDPLKSATIYRVVEKEGSFRLEAVSFPLPKGAEPMAASLNAMAHLPESPLPEGSHVNSVKKDGDLAEIDFNRAFQENFPTGLEDQALAVNAILQSLAQFHGVERVQLLVEGKKLPEMDTHIDLTQPIPVRGEATAQAEKAQ